jgi:hypothetical protein
MQLTEYSRRTGNEQHRNRELPDHRNNPEYGPAGLGIGGDPQPVDGPAGGQEKRGVAAGQDPDQDHQAQEIA